MKLIFSIIPKKIVDSIKTISILALATILALFITYITNNYSNVALLYILAIILISIFTKGYLWGIIASLVGTLAVNYFFTIPYYEFNFTRYGYPIIFIEMLLISFITSAIMQYTKSKTNEALELLSKTSKLNEINNKLLSANGLSYISELAIDYINKLTKSTVVFYFYSPQLGDPGIIKSVNKAHEPIIHSYHERFVANWVFEHKESAGVGTSFCGNSCLVYLPLISHDKVWGVIGIYCYNNPIHENIITFITLMISQVAMALERQYLTDSRHRMVMESEKEMMRANLLRAVSHDLRTPLTGIIGTSETLLMMNDKLSKEEERKSLQYIYDDSNWLLNMVENLLSVTRLRDGNSTVKKTPEPLDEVVSEAIQRIKKRFKDINILVEIPAEYILLPMDATLIEQVIINLVENAYKHSTSSRPIILNVTRQEDYVFFQVIDHGKGLEESRIEFIFDGYSPHDNNSSDATKGTGIGLSICKTIISAHGGTITAKNGLENGAIFTFCLPIEGGSYEQ